MSDKIDKLFDEYANSKLPYTTLFPKTAFRAGFLCGQNEIEKLTARLAIYREAISKVVNNPFCHTDIATILLSAVKKGGKE